MIPRLKEFVLKQFNTDQYELISEFPMLHAGWECDETVALIRVNGTTQAIGTNHGSPCLLSFEDLRAKAHEYSVVLEKTLTAMRAIEIQDGNVPV